MCLLLFPLVVKSEKDNAMSYVVYAVVSQKTGTVATMFFVQFLCFKGEDRCNCWFDAYKALYGECPKFDMTFTGYFE